MMLYSIGQWDAHPNRLYTKTLSRVDLFDTFVMIWLAHPHDDILNVIHDSRDLVWDVY